MKRVLMIAYHFPPIQMSSGIHRTVQFAKHLPTFGWEPLILTVHPRAYPIIGDDDLGGLPKNTVVKRAFALDSSRHLSVRNAYLSFTSVPDRWVTWYPHGVISCMKLIKKYNPSIIWSTFPIASAHLIALTVSRLTGLPWVADFRDPMIQRELPEPGLVRKTYQWIEKKVIQHSSNGVFVSRSSLRFYKRNYPEKTIRYWQMIENGYDEDLFQIENTVPGNVKLVQDSPVPIKMVHSGILYSKGRNPIAFLKALNSYIRSSSIFVNIAFRGAGSQMDFKHYIGSLGLKGQVKAEPAIPYAEAIKEMLESDVLLLFQGEEYNKQIPAKVYEYIRAGKPILAMVDRKGDTAEVLKKWDGVFLADINSSREIYTALKDIITYVQSSMMPKRDLKAVFELSRKAGSLKLSNIMNNLLE